MKKDLSRSLWYDIFSSAWSPFLYLLPPFFISPSPVTSLILTFPPLLLLSLHFSLKAHVLLVERLKKMRKGQVGSSKWFKRKIICISQPQRNYMITRGATGGGAGGARSHLHFILWLRKCLQIEERHFFSLGRRPWIISSSPPSQNYPVAALMITTPRLNRGWRGGGAAYGK